MNYSGLEVSVGMTVENGIFREVMPCNLIEVHRKFR